MSADEDARALFATERKSFEGGGPFGPDSEHGPPWRWESPPPPSLERALIAALWGLILCGLAVSLALWIAGRNPGPIPPGLRGSPESDDRPAGRPLRETPGPWLDPASVARAARGTPEISDVA